jgi:hypothetical protein
VSATTSHRLALAVVALLVLPPLASAEPLAPPAHRRPVEQTYLTFPEWFLVFSPAEYAAFTRHNDPNDFPFLGHIREFWQSYAAVTDATLQRGDALNVGYHVMINVIGISTTIEYALRSVYETIVGRLSAATRSSAATPEDVYAAQVAQAYVDFIRNEPWYKFDFAARLVGLWRTTDLVGPDMIRKWERKYALTTEYLIKAAYGWLIGQGTAAGYEAPSMVTAVVTDRDDAVALLPRYAGFTAASRELARRGVNFREIAGNPAATDILVSIVVPTAWHDSDVEARPLFVQPILTQRGTERVTLVMSVGTLAENLRRLDAAHARIEHVFDY